MTNPYTFGSPVDDAQHFADRREELRSVVGLMQDGQNAIVISPRRYGKTSLLLRSIEQVRRRGGRTGYASLARCTSRREVCEELLRSSLNGPLGWMRKRSTQVGELLSHLRIRPELALQPDGAFAVRFAPVPSLDRWDDVLADTLRLLRHAGAPGHPVSLVIDEFQRIAEIPPGLGGLFKSMVDELRGISLVLSGSRQHMMRALTEGTAAPLYGMGERIFLDVIPERDMVDHLCRRARDAGSSMDPEVAREIYRRAGGVPNDVQRLAYAAYASSDSGIDSGSVERGLRTVVAHESVEYSRRFAALRDAPSQQRLLKVLARTPTASPYTHRFLDEVEVANANAVRVGLRRLEERELVSRRDGLYAISDPFFREWLAAPTFR